jgi:cysteine desulfurase/selenocysteine lyase
MDIDAIRTQFPVTQRYTFLDNASLAPLPLAVVDAVANELRERAEFGVEKFWGWLDNIEILRGNIARLIGATPEEIAFTQNTSEGINIVANGIDWREGDNVVISDLEYFPNTYPWYNQARKGVEVRVVRHRHGFFPLEAVAALIDSRTRVVSLSHVAWVNGYRMDLDALSRLCRAHGAYFCIDAIQSTGATPVDVSDGQVDFLACGGHKWLFSPTGTGFFYCRKDLIGALSTSVVGWQSDARPSGSQAYGFAEDFTPGPSARRFNHGNSNLAGLHGMHASLKLLDQVGWRAVQERSRMLADIIVDALAQRGFRFFSPLASEHRTNIVNIAVSDVQATMAALKAAQIQVSSRLGGVRVSPAFYNTEAEVERFIDVIVRTELERNADAQ